MEDGEIDGNKVTLDWAKPKGEGGFGGRSGGRGGRGGFGGRGWGGFRGGGGGDHKPQGKMKFDWFLLSLSLPLPFERKDSGVFTLLPDQ